MDDQAPQEKPVASKRRRFAERFEVLRFLGEGGMGTVYLAHDLRTQRQVALKVLLGADPDALTRFKQEFRALADVSHPNLIVLHELLCDRGTWLFTMDYVEGRDFLQHVSVFDGRDAPTLLEVDAVRQRSTTASGEGSALHRCTLRDPQLLQHVLAQLVDAVRTLHAADKLHLDLKPSNVLVRADDHVTVLDFGLARDLRQRPAETLRLVGTPAYIAPEHAESGRFERASDWYAVGVMLYEALTGRLPFEGPIGHVLLSKTSRMPDPPSKLCRDVPRELEQLCMALLARDPRERPSGDALAAWLGSALPRPSSRPAATRRHFVGRAELLARLHTESGGPRQPRVLLLHGASGVGKTALAERFVDELATDPRRLVLRGACFERESVPYKAFDGVMDVLMAELQKLPPLEQGALLPRHAHTLSRLFPAFGAVAPRALHAARGLDDDDPALGRARAFRAFAELFARLCDQRDLVLFIDDLHFSDLDSALLLRALFEGDAPVPLLLVGTCRSGQSAEHAVVRELRELALKNGRLWLREEELGALGPEATRTLARELLRESGGDPEFAEQLASEAHGVPLFVHELVRHVVGHGAPGLRKVSLNEALAARTAELSEQPARMLERIAVAGDLPQRLALAMEQASASPEALLHHLRVSGLIKAHSTGHEDYLEPAHERVRAAVLARLSNEQLRAIHQTLWATFASEATPDEQRLFRHSLGAGELERALDHAQRAATEARESLAFHQSAELSRRALELLAQVSPSDRQRRAALLEGLADALSASGYALDAADAYLESATLCAGRASFALERRAADQLLRGGDLARGTALLGAVLERAGVSYPRNPRAALTALAFERARLFARGLSFDERALSEIAPESLELLESLRVALGVYWLVEPVRGALFATMYLRHALDAGHARHVLRGLETEAAYVALTGGGKAELRSGELYASARALTARIGGASTHAGYKIAEAGYHAIYGRKHESSECAREALAAPRQHGASWERTYARFHLYQNTLYIGAQPGLAGEIERHASEAEARRDRFGTATLLPMLAMARLMSDQPAAAHEALARMRTHLSEEVFSFLDMQEMIWTAVSHQYEGEALRAVAHYASREPRCALSGIPRLTTWRLLHRWGLLLAHLGVLEQDPRAAYHAEQAEQQIKLIERERIAWPLAFASMGRAALAHVRGDERARSSALGRAIAQAEALRYTPFAALFRRSQALLEGLHEDVRAQDAALQKLGVCAPARWQRTWAPCLR